jgi:endonuclease/exonuclease/phosphatase family metal-dependent hydrolase
VPLVVGLPLVALLLTPKVEVAAADTPKTIRVMTYNIHQGFSAGQTPSLDRIAEVISLAGPDVVMLQEVVRGWMIDQQHDALGILSERLRMPYVFAPNIGDLYGNAILSRYPMTDVKRVHFAVQPSLRHQPRGAVGVHIGGVLFVVTHLDDIADSSSIRQEEVRTIFREWDGERLAIIGGDMNAEPGDLEMQLFSEAGYGDLADVGPTTAEEPGKRIDYLWGIGVTAQGPPTKIGSVGASDHFALVVNVTRP